MGVLSGSTITFPTSAGQVLVERTFPAPQSVRLGLIVTASYNFDALLEVWDGSGAVIFDMALPVLPPALIIQGLGPFSVPANGRIRLVSRNAAVAPGPAEVQATLDVRPWGER